MLWERVKAHLQETLTDNIYQLWIDPIEELGRQGELLYLKTPDRYFSAYVKHNFLPLIEAGLAECRTVWQWWQGPSKRRSRL